MSTPLIAGKRIAIRVLVIACLVLGAFAARVLSSASSELALAQERHGKGDFEAAVVHYRRAARFYVPLSPYHVRALSELAKIGATAEREGKVELALSAYRAVRGSILAARSFYVPEQARLAEANLRIATLMAGQPAPPVDAGKSREQLKQEHLELLRADPGPHVGFSLLVLLGFALWVCGAFGFSQLAIDENDRLVRQAALRWGALIVVGFGLFVLGLSLA